MPTTEEDALRFFYDNSDHTVFFDMGWVLSNPWFEETLGSYGITVDMVLTSTSSVLEMAAGGWIRPYSNFFFEYMNDDEKKCIIISLVPCILSIDTEAVLPPPKQHAQE